MGYRSEKLSENRTENSEMDRVAKEWENTDEQEKKRFNRRLEYRVSLTLLILFLGCGIFLIILSLGGTYREILIRAICYFLAIVCVGGIIKILNIATSFRTAGNFLYFLGGVAVISLYGSFQVRFIFAKFPSIDEYIPDWVIITAFIGVFILACGISIYPVFQTLKHPMEIES